MFTIDYLPDQAPKVLIEHVVAESKPGLAVYGLPVLTWPEGMPPVRFVNFAGRTADGGHPDNAVVEIAQAAPSPRQDAPRENPVFPTRDAAAAMRIHPSIGYFLTRGGRAEGDGLGGLWSDTDNGSADRFQSADGRLWFRVRDIDPERIRPRNPFSSPVATVREIDPVRNIFRGLPAFAFELQDGVDFFVWRSAWGHGNERPGTRLVGRRTVDVGYSWAKPIGPGNAGPSETLIYTDPDTDVRNAAAGIMNGRLGILAARVRPDDKHEAPVFLSTDDLKTAATWSAAELAGTAGRWNFHGSIHPWPAFAGGDDRNGFIAYFYTFGKQGLGAFTTIDNGRTWSERPDIIMPSSTPAISEMDVVRLGDSRRWLMFMRTGQNMVCSRSTDMVRWSRPVDTGFALKPNPPALLYADNSVWLITWSREGHQILPESRNAMISMRGDPETLWNSCGVSGWAAPEVVTNLGMFPTGYPSFYNKSGRWHGLFTAENYAGSTQSTDGYLMMVSGDTFNPAPRPPGRQLIPSLGLDFWPLGTSVPFSTRKLVVPGLTAARGSGATGATASRVDGVEAPYALRIGRDDGDTGDQPIIAVVNFPQLVAKRLAGKQVTFSARVRKGKGFSAARSFLGVQFRQTTHPEEQAIGNPAGMFRVGDAPVGSSASGWQLTADWQPFQITPGRLTDNAAGLALRIFWVPTGVAKDDYMEIELMKAEEGDGPTEYLAPDLYEQKQWADRFSQVFQVVVDAGETANLNWPGGAMHVAPTVSVDAGRIIGTPTIYGFRLKNDSKDAITVTVKASSLF